MVVNGGCRRLVLEGYQQVACLVSSASLDFKQVGFLGELVVAAWMLRLALLDAAFLLKFVDDVEIQTRPYFIGLLLGTTPRLFLRALGQIGHWIKLVAHLCGKLP